MMARVHSSEHLSLNFFHHLSELRSDPASNYSHSDSSTQEPGESCLGGLIVDDLSLISGALLSAELASDSAVSDRISGSLHGVN